MTNDSNPLNSAYFDWLYSLVGTVQSREYSESHMYLFTQMYSKVFTWFIPNDDNRVEDGKALRATFLDETRFRLDIPYEHFYAIDCSMLEMFIALSQQAAFLSDGRPVDWFWRMMHNLGLDQFTDSVYGDASAREVEDILDKVIERRYEFNGIGGVFPLLSAQNDQRKVELWYQLQAYLVEGSYLSVSPQF